jgi:hypothetical protein
MCPRCALPAHRPAHRARNTGLFVPKAAGSASALLTGGATDISVPWRPSVVTVVLTHLVTRPAARVEDLQGLGI